MFRIKTYALVSLLALASVARGYVMTSAAEHVVKVDFSQTFADAAAGHATINRTNKGDRLSADSASAAMRVHTIAVRRPASTPEIGCETLAAPYADHVLGHIIGRCDV